MTTLLPTNYDGACKPGAPTKKHVVAVACVADIGETPTLLALEFFCGLVKLGMDMEGVLSEQSLKLFAPDCVLCCVEVEDYRRAQEAAKSALAACGKLDKAEIAHWDNSKDDWAVVQSYTGLPFSRFFAAWNFEHTSAALERANNQQGE